MFLLFAATIILSLVVVAFLTRKRLPPGPYGLPFVGCVPYIRARSAHLTVERWCREYGGLLSFYMGSTLVVVLGDCETVREAFLKNGDAFNGRCVIRAFRAKGLSQGIGTCLTVSWYARFRPASYTLAFQVLQEPKVTSGVSNAGSA